MLIPTQALAAKPSASVHLPAYARQGSTVVVKYKTRVPRGDTLKLEMRTPQKQWEVCGGLAQGSGKTRVRFTASGVIRFRVVEVRRHHRPEALGGVITVNVPTVFWNLPSSNDSALGVSLPFGYGSALVPSGGTVVVQEQQGTGHVWNTYATMTGTSGNAGLTSPQQIGQNYAFRVAVLDGSTLLATSAVSDVNVFGRVPFSTLTAPSYWVNPGTYNGPTFTFPFEFQSGGGTTSAPKTVLSVATADNDCTIVHVDYVVGPLPGVSGDPNATETVSVIQQSANPVSSTTPVAQQSSVDATVIPGQSWAVNAASAVGWNVYLNGYAICDSTQPIITAG